MSRNSSFVLLLVVAAVLALISVAAVAQFGKHVKEAPAASSNFEETASLPTCEQSAVQNGDLNKGEVVLLVKVKSGCVIPMHWHSADEQLMIVSGTGKMEIKGGGIKELKAGDYLYTPAKQAHEFTCTSECTFFVTRNGKTDFHYIDSAGKEIPVEQALKNANEQPGAQAKK